MDKVLLTVETQNLIERKKLINRRILGITQLNYYRNEDDKQYYFEDAYGILAVYSSRVHSEKVYNELKERISIHSKEIYTFPDNINMCQFK